MTTPTATSMKLRFPEFADVSDPVIEFAIEEARLEISEDNWSTGFNVALLYLSAHYVSCSITRAASGGTGGEGTIASESIGRLSISYSKDATKPEATADDKESTSYGRRYLEILDGNFSGPVIV